MAGVVEGSGAAYPLSWETHSRLVGSQALQSQLASPTVSAIPLVNVDESNYEEGSNTETGNTDSVHVSELPNVVHCCSFTEQEMQLELESLRSRAKGNSSPFRRRILPILARYVLARKWGAAAEPYAASLVTPDGTLCSSFLPELASREKECARPLERHHGSPLRDYGVAPQPPCQPILCSARQRRQTVVELADSAWGAARSDGGVVRQESKEQLQPPLKEWPAVQAAAVACLQPPCAPSSKHPLFSCPLAVAPEAGVGMSSAPLSGPMASAGVERWGTFQERRPFSKSTPRRLEESFNMEHEHNVASCVSKSCAESPPVEGAGNGCSYVPVTPLRGPRDSLNPRQWIADSCFASASSGVRSAIAALRGSNAQDDFDPYVHPWLACEEQQRDHSGFTIPGVPFVDSPELLSDIDSLEALAEENKRLWLMHAWAQRGLRWQREEWMSQASDETRQRTAQPSNVCLQPHPFVYLN
ncbi:hypothetical protein ERJ75_000354500 [Trypanosoma vivax]|uniref:Uncharacterized protein n=1 Tax=Trypanosoma vivax (strain Y486) TaxID=1055687 RepID=G0TZR1_TRYVY|nr:hypothetical protein TRVL_01412 [Trypanosoma vivax]KAH8617650.1 hypothetical protein ERJ75_000354500 [Trypanosoma vivax]CCC50089.1 conserved hypothetical protein [Trypanosoma vivax Y486]